MIVENGKTTLSFRERKPHGTFLLAVRSTNWQGKMEKDDREVELTIEQAVDFHLWFASVLRDYYTRRKTNLRE